MIERIPPHNKEAERAVLGSMILDNSMIEKIDGIITQDDFYLESSRRIFNSILIAKKTGIADIITVCNILRDAGQLDHVGGMLFISDLVDNIPSAANIVYYANIVKENSIRRNLLNSAYEITNMAFSTQEPISEIIEKSQKNIMSINPITGRSNILPARELVKKTFQEIEFRNKKGGMIGISTGLRDLDEATGGLHKGELTIIAGRPSMGKSALAVNIADTAGQRGDCSLICSIEMPNETIMVRMFSRMTEIESRNIRRGYIGDVDWPRLTYAAGKLSESKVYFDDSPEVTPAELRRIARKAKSDYGIELLVLDYMQLMQPSTKTTSREQEVAEISRTLKGIARELNIAVIGVSQLNRNVDQRPNKRPMLSDLRESGAIEQDADLILFVYRDEVYNKSEDNPEKGIAEIIIGKQRNGDIPIIKTVFQAKYQRFVDMQREDDKPWRKKT
ncbi:MAG: replicative DNA helicase [Eubacteriales bacterium]|nr:replicative DNA helicase [Eubacteriales bacterium]